MRQHRERCRFRIYSPESGDPNFRPWASRFQMTSTQIPVHIPIWGLSLFRALLDQYACLEAAGGRSPLQRCLESRRGDRPGQRVAVPVSVVPVDHRATRRLSARRLARRHRGRFQSERHGAVVGVVELCHRRTGRLHARVAHPTHSRGCWGGRHRRRRRESCWCRRPGWVDRRRAGPVCGAGDVRAERHRRLRPLCAWQDGLGDVEKSSVVGVIVDPHRCGADAIRGLNQRAMENSKMGSDGAGDTGHGN